MALFFPSKPFVNQRLRKHEHNFGMLANNSGQAMERHFWLMGSKIIILSHSFLCQYMFLCQDFDKENPLKYVQIGISVYC